MFEAIFNYSIELVFFVGLKKLENTLEKKFKNTIQQGALRAYNELNIDEDPLFFLLVVFLFLNLEITYFL